MDEAKIVMNLKEGIIELQGPVEFVQHYLDTYQFAIKGLQVLNKSAVSELEAKASPRKRKGLLRSKPKETKRTSSVVAIRSFLQDGFFDEPRSAREVRQRLNEVGVALTSNAIRTSLGKLSVAGLLARVTNGKRSVLYRRIADS